MHKAFIFHVKPEELAKLTMPLLTEAGAYSHFTARIPRPPEQAIPDHVRIDVSCSLAKADCIRTLIQSHKALSLSEADVLDI